MTEQCFPNPSVVTEPSRRNLTDNELIRRIRKHEDGWRASFDELIRRHEAWVFRRCRYHLGNHHDAQDATQEILLRALHGLERFEGRSGFRTWMFTIIENRCRSFAVSRSRQILTAHTAALIRLYEESQTHRQSPESDISRQVINTLDMIPQSAREVLEMRFFRDYSFKEIATHLDIGLSAAKMRLYRALESFREKYVQVYAPAKDY